MSEQAHISKKPGFAQQLEPIFAQQRTSRRSLRSQPGPTPPQPDFTRDLQIIVNQTQPEPSNLLAFRRSAP